MITLTRLFSVTVDDWGLRWREPGRRMRKSSPGTRRRRLLCCAIYGWSRRVRAVRAGWARGDAVVATKPTDSAQRAHEQLAALIVARTKLPLRDITADVEAAQSAQNPDPMTAIETKVSLERKRAELAAHLALSGSPHEPQTIAESGTAPTPTSGAHVSAASVRAGCLIFLAALLLPWILQGAGWGLQQYQSHYYGDALSQAHVQQPVFEDRLAYDDGRWPVAEDNEYPRVVLSEWRISL